MVVDAVEDDLNALERVHASSRSVRDASTSVHVFTFNHHLP